MSASKPCALRCLKQLAKTSCPNDLYLGTKPGAQEVLASPEACTLGESILLDGRGGRRGGLGSHFSCQSFLRMDLNGT